MTEYWFRRRRGLFSKDLGWGWIPISLEGWLITFGLILGLYNFVIMDLKIKWVLFGLLILCFAIIADSKTKDRVLFK